MPIRDTTIIRWAEEHLNMPATYRPGDEAMCPSEEDFEQAGVSADTWWATVQEYDAAYVRLGEAIDWTQVLKLIFPDGQAAPLNAGPLAEALDEQTGAMTAPHAHLLPGAAPLTHIDWRRLLSQAQGHWLQRFQGSDVEEQHGPQVDEAALREAFLSVDGGNRYGTDQIAPRVRPLRELYEGGSASRASRDRNEGYLRRMSERMGR